MKGKRAEDPPVWDAAGEKERLERSFSQRVPEKTRSGRPAVGLPLIMVCTLVHGLHQAEVKQEREPSCASRHQLSP